MRILYAQFTCKKRQAKVSEIFSPWLFDSSKLQKDCLFVLNCWIFIVATGLVWRRVFFPGGSARRGNVAGVAAQQANTLHTGPVRPAGHMSCILKPKKV